MTLPASIVIIGAVFAAIGVLTVGWLVKAVYDWNKGGM